MDILSFDKSAAAKAADIHAKLMNSGKPPDIQDVLIAGIVISNKEEDETDIRITHLLYKQLLFDS